MVVVVVAVVGAVVGAGAVVVVVVAAISAQRAAVVTTHPPTHSLTQICRFSRRGEHSVLQKRFNEFSSLRSELLQTNPSISSLEFPKKAILKDKVRTAPS